MTAIEIRPFDAVDLALAERIHSDAFGSAAWDRKALAEILAMPHAGGLVAVDPSSAAPLGFLLHLMVVPEAELLTVAVPHAARRRGVGRALVEAFLALATASGATRALLEAAEDNRAALALYGRLGFKLSGRRKDYYERPGGRHVAAQLLERTLP